MGIDVSAQRVVTFNDTHEKRVVTDPNRPIPTTICGEIPVVSIFRRRKTSHDEEDGNPLIYALKGLHDYSIPHSDFRSIWRSALTILPVAVQSLSYDMVVPLPSSSEIPKMLAVRTSRMRGGCMILPCLQKATIGQVLQSAPSAAQVESRHKRDYTSQLRTFQSLSENSIIQMKRIKVPIRPYFKPVAMNWGGNLCVNREVLLVDDIVGSGSSLVAAANTLLEHGASCVTALTLMSRLS